MPSHQHIAQIAIVRGVSGSGKTTMGRALADPVACEFEDGDRLHPLANIAKMKRGEALTDNDRAPWLAAIAARIDGWREHAEDGVISCSALKRDYRRISIGARPEPRLVYFKGSHDLVADRLAHRHGHFMPASLLDSQLETLEPPTLDEHPITIEMDRPIAEIVDELVKALSQEHRNVRNQVAGLTEAS